MKVVVGLGNPGPRYETTRHNVGFLALDRLIERWSAQGPQKKHEAEIYTASVKGEKVLLIKPQTFMNLSGKSVAPVMAMHKCEPGDLLVLYDELDLKPRQIRIKTGGGAGGHNGIKSIDASLGALANNYHRLRIGIGHPRAMNLPIGPADYVLQQFSDGELELLDPLFDRIALAAEKVISGDVKAAQTEFNRTEEEE
jgi:PTH1 family peptidyl-tRNA hydrolase